MRLSCARSISVVFLFWIGNGRALAAPRSSADEARARQFFDVGQEAYEKSEYLLAIEAFEQAYAIVQRPGLLFSLGQAHQRQFRLKPDEGELQAALDAYRRYVASASDGRHRSEAVAAIESLSRIGEQLHPRGVDTPAAAIFGKLLLSSPTPGVEITVGGERVETLPVALQLPNNVYEVVASAPGYEAARNTLQIVAGTTIPLNIELRALPAQLNVDGPVGSEAFVDGQPMGFLPARLAQLPPGTHWVTVQKAGRRTRTVRVDLVRGQSVDLKLDLVPTAQRTAAWVMGAGSAATLLATGVFIGFAADRQHSASDLDARRTQGQVSLAEARELNSAVGARDRLRTLAVVSGVSTAGLLSAALALYWSDTPTPPNALDRASLARSAAGHLEVNVTASPNACAAVLKGRF